MGQIQWYLGANTVAYEENTVVFWANTLVLGANMVVFESNSVVVWANTVVSIQKQWYF